MNMGNIKIETLKLGGSNSYLLECRNGYILVDTGMKGAGKKLSEKLNEMELKPKAIKMILLTHSHYDHVQGLEEIKQLTHAPVAIHKDELAMFGRESLMNNESSFIFRLIIKIFGGITPDTDEKAIKTDILITDDMDLDNYGVDAKIVHTPGHSPGSVCIVTGDGQCICGDTLFDMFPGTHYPIIVYNRIKLAETYRKLDSMNPAVYYPGHGKPITREKFKSKIMNRDKYFRTGG